ncbi:unnamed protein product [Caretta caretta]
MAQETSIFGAESALPIMAVAGYSGADPEPTVMKGKASTGFNAHCCRDWLKRLQSEYWKTRDQNPTLSYSPTLGLFSEEFDCVLGVALSTEPTMVHDNLVSQGGARLAPESSMGTDGSQEQVPSPLPSVGRRTSTAHSQGSTRLAQCTITEGSVVTGVLVQ